MNDTPTRRPARRATARARRSQGPELLRDRPVRPAQAGLGTAPAPGHRMLDESGPRTRAAMAAAQDDTRPRQADPAVAGGRGKGVSVPGPDRPDRPDRQENGPVPAGSGLGYG